MTIPEEDLTEADKQSPIKVEKKTDSEAETNVPVFDPTSSLMPELEELVKKNPNLLIGCGG